MPAETPVVTFNHIPFYSSWTTLIGYDEDPLVATLATIKGKKQFRHTVGNVLAVMEAMRGHRYALALGSHMHAAEHASFVTDGVQLRSEVSAAIVGGNDLGAVVLPSGFRVYEVRDGVVGARRFVRLDASGVRP